MRPASWMAVVIAVLAACTYDFERYRYPGAGGTGAGPGAQGGQGASAGQGGGGSPPTGPGSVAWALQLGGTELDVALAVAAHPAGSAVVAAGAFTGSFQVGDEAPLTAMGERELFVLSVEPDGAIRWLRHYGGSGAIFVRDAVIDRQGDIVLVGSFTGGVDLGGGLRAASGSNSSADLFVVKYDADGNWRWDVVYGGAGEEILQAVAVSPTDEVHVAGSFDAPFTMGTTMLTNAGTADILMARFTAEGALQEARTVGTSGTSRANDIAVDMMTGDIVLTGTFDGTIDTGTSILAAGAGTSVLVLQQDSTSFFGVAFDSPGLDQGLAVAFDPTGAWWIAGLSQGDIDLGGGTYTGLGSDDIFALKRGITKHDFSSLYGDRARQHARALATDGSSNAILVGALMGSADFGTGVVTSQGSNDAFVAKLAPDGAGLWSRAFGDAGDQRAHGVATDASGIYVVGELQGSIDFDGTVMTSRGAQDGFLIKLRP